MVARESDRRGGLGQIICVILGRWGTLLGKESDHTTTDTTDTEPQHNTHKHNTTKTQRQRQTQHTHTTHTTEIEPQHTHHKHNTNTTHTQHTTDTTETEPQHTHHTNTTHTHNTTEPDTQKYVLQYRTQHKNVLNPYNNTVHCGITKFRKRLYKELPYQRTQHKNDHIMMTRQREHTFSTTDKPDHTAPNPTLHIEISTYLLSPRMFCRRTCSKFREHGSENCI